MLKTFQLFEFTLHIYNICVEKMMVCILYVTGFEPLLQTVCKKKQF